MPDESDGDDAEVALTEETAAALGLDEVPEDLDVEDDEEDVPPRISDDGIMLVFAGGACLLAGMTASVTGQPRPIVAFAAIATVPAVVAVVADVLTGYVPDNRVHLLVGGAALLGALAAVPGQHWVNVATLGAAAALVLWRVFDIEFRGAER